MKYAKSSRIIHWLMAAIIFVALATGIYMTNKELDVDFRQSIYNFHKSIGVVIFILIIYRIINRFVNKPPKLPSSISPIEQKLAKIGHFALYLLMITTPISGYLMSSYAGFNVIFFGIEIPNILSQGNLEIAQIFLEIHEVSAFSLLGVIVLHILGALKHRFYDKPENDVLNRII